MWIKTITPLAALGVVLVASPGVGAQSSPPAGTSSTAQSGAAPTGDAAKPADAAKKAAQPAQKPATKLSSLAGKVKSVGAMNLTLETKAKPPKEYTFDLTGAAIKVGGKEAAATDLKEGDEIRVSYTQSEGKLVAKTVARIVKPAK